MREFDDVANNPKSLSAARRSLLLLMSGAAALGFFNLTQSGRTGYNVPQIDLAAAKELVEKGVTVIDVRGQDIFNAAHLPTAVLVPLEVLRQSIPVWLTVLKAQPVLVYCGDGSTRGPEATQLLVDAGFAHPVNLTAGMSGWRDAGYKVEKA